MSLKPSFEGRKVLVTGGARGIGFAIAKKFLDAGATVTILDQDVSETIRENHPQITVLTCNLAEWKETRVKISSAGPFHHLVNNAGIARPAKTLMEIEPQHFDEVFGINLKSMINVIQAVAQGMIDAKLENATIVNMSSISDTVAVPGMALYSCSKAGVTMLTKCSALELAPHGIRVNCVRPAMVRTEQVGRLAGSNVVLDNAIKINERRVIGRMVEMDEVADSVIFLSSSASTMITGSDILLDGGIFTR